MILEIADNIWCEMQRVCRAARYSPQVTAERTLQGFVGLMKMETSRKSELGEAWVQERFLAHPAAEFATFELAGSPKLEIPDEIAAPFVEYAQALGYDPSKFANHSLACVTNGIAKKYLGKNQAAFTI